MEPSQLAPLNAILSDTAWKEGWVKPIIPQKEYALSVGIIGAGPAGLAAAEELRNKGWQVTVYDRHDRAGGLSNLWYSKLQVR